MLKNYFKRKERKRVKRKKRKSPCEKDSKIFT
jgi:hypothetical protein